MTGQLRGNTLLICSKPRVRFPQQSVMQMMPWRCVSRAEGLVQWVLNVTIDELSIKSMMVTYLWEDSI